MSAAASWLRFRERGSLVGMRFIVWLYRLFGRRLCGVFILPVVGYFYLTGGQARLASRRYLTQLHEWSEGRLPRRHRPTWWDGFHHFREFGLNILDRVGFWRGDTSGFELIVHGEEHLMRLREARHGAVVISAHLGSFDALRLYAARGQAVVTVVTYLEHARMINAIFKQLNPAVDMRMITPAMGSVGWFFELRARVASGELVGILADRVGPNEGRHVSILPFLGIPAPFPQGPFLLASRLRCPRLLMVALRRDFRRYEIFVEPLGGESGADANDGAGSVEELVKAFVKRLEFYCMLAPYQWFNFYDFWGAAAGAQDPDRPPSVMAAAGGREAST
jgi:predicted LPLAT superfamily acyltransferase